MEEHFMASKIFTEEEINYLKTSDYVLDASPHIVHFSAEFKAKFWDLILAGKTPREIVIELGIDPNILGEKRIAGLKSMIRNEVRAGNGFRDLNTYSTYPKKFVNPEAWVKYLEQQLSYKDQEIEFLKKIVSLNRGEVDS
jgi:hypothetical protein